MYYMSIEKARLYSTAYVTAGKSAGQCVRLIGAYIALNGLLTFCVIGAEWTEYRQSELERFAL